MTDPVFTETLRRISEDPLSIHDGLLAQEIAKDIQQRGGIVTEDDLRNSTVNEREVLATSMSDEDTLYTTSTPSSGASLILVLNILKGTVFAKTKVSSSSAKAFEF